MDKIQKYTSKFVENARGYHIKLQELRIILLGQKTVGKSATGNTLLHKEVFASSQNEQCQMQDGEVSGRRVTVIDTPGWWQNSSCCTDETDKEIARGFSLSPHLFGPHAFLLVIDADASFNATHLDAVTSHVELLGDGVWRHTIIVFTRGDWLETNSIEQYIEGEGEALQSLVEQCGNRYHVVDNKNASDGTQISELLEKITETVAANGWGYFVPDQQIFQTLEERRRKVKEGAMLRQSQVKATRESLGGMLHYHLASVALYGNLLKLLCQSVSTLLLYVM
uniref:AIG1-type G domain-containing protein n=1 Tax=Pundamilia nyererei TaxID=303518 RepID=A0A3B4FRK1_9CICH